MNPEPESRPELKDLETILTAESEALKGFLDGLHAADLAEWLVELDEPAVQRVTAALDDEKLAEVLSFADDVTAGEMLAFMSVPQVVRVVEGLPADEVVDLLALVDDAKAEQVLRSVDFERAQGLRKLARYDAETAGGLMTTEFVAVPQDAYVSDAIKVIKSEEGPAGNEDFGVFVVDEANRPVGFVSDRELLTTNIHTPIRDVMETDVITASIDADQEDVAQLVSKYSLSAVPVVDAGGALLGVVSAEDAQEVLQEEAEEDIRRLVGTSRAEQTRLPVLSRVRHRLPLQVLTVIGGLITAHILDRAFGSQGDGQHSTSDVLRYLPIVLGLAGNVGIQSSTILVRAFATGELSQEREASVLGSEILVGLLIGILCGLTTMFLSSYIEGGGSAGMHFGASVGTAIVIAVTWASLLGCLVPMLCQRLGIDPAIVAGPFLITLSDVSGATIFVTVSSIGLGLR